VEGAEISKLNCKLGDGPFPDTFFEKLVTARDSVIHHDSQGKWDGQKQVRVADEYVNAYGRLDFTEEHLNDAVDKVIRQLKWYDDQINALTNAWTT
jgi:hypothetical protein